LKETTVDNLATLKAYKNGNVRAYFVDRTLVNMNQGEKYAKLITKLGEEVKLSIDQPIGYERYIQVCLEFIDWAFTPEYERMLREDKKEHDNAIIQAELDQINRAMCLIDNKVPEKCTIDHSLYMNTYEEDDDLDERDITQSIEKAVTMNEKCIRDLQNTLNSIKL